MLQRVLLDKAHKVDQENFHHQDNSQAEKALTLVAAMEVAYPPGVKVEHHFRKVETHSFLHNLMQDKTPTLVADLEALHQMDPECMFQKEDHPLV